MQEIKKSYLNILLFFQRKKQNISVKVQNKYNMKKRDLVFYIIGVVLIIIGLFYDAQISRFFAENRASIINSVMIFASFLANWYIWIFIALILSLILWKGKKQFIAPLWLSVIIGQAVVFILKLIIIRERPYDALGIIGLDIHSDSSFPSGHAAAVFSILPVIERAFKKTYLIFLLFACLVVLSRIYLGAHYLTDVATGALIAYTIGLIVVEYKDKIVFWKKK